MKNTQLVKLKRVSKNNENGHPVKDLAFIDSEMVSAVSHKSESMQFSTTHGLDMSGFERAAVGVDFLDKAIKAGSNKVSYDPELQKISFHSERGVLSTPDQLSGLVEEFYVPGSEINNLTYLFTVTSNDLLSFKPYMSKDDLRPARCGIFFDVESGYMVATNGHILRRLGFETDEMNGSFILPAGVTSVLSKNTTYKVSKLGKQYVFADSQSDDTIISEEIIEPYPNWASIWPENLPGSATFETTKMLDSLKMARIVSDTRVQLVNEGNAMHVHSEDVDLSEEYHTDEPVGTFTDFDYKGISFNPVYLEQVIKSCESDEVTMRLSTPSKAATVNGHSLLMPIRFDV